ncbi:MAG: BREX-2 system adenine-specific DNA-methyltransferase PglX [Candidatus Schekmanbacteria bacterium]|nr:BREX-2 system adenine-specific DNA-methyltransferase PglX [Candidatus Schekmanbacteria bacterium]
MKDRFALCQTPDFVRAFILDRTLTPAIETFGADKVRLLDPACGSGHFLIDGLKRLVAATAELHQDWSQRQVVLHTIDRVVGIDLNDYACALARTRLVMTAAELAGVSTLAGAAQFHPQVYWADGLEQVERDEAKRPVQGDLFMKVEEKLRAVLTRSDVRAALKKVFATKFHAVVANPPYITEKDSARKDYHREKLGKGPRYVSAYREYSLASPFTERCFQLAEKSGYVGIITSNNFMKREFGKPLIEKVLAGLDLTLVVDTSQAYIPFHGTPTVLIFGRNREATANQVRAVMGKRGESGTPDDPAKGRVWSSIVQGWNTVGFENEYVSVADLPRETLGKHPWSLGGGGAAELKELLQGRASQALGALVEIGTGAVTREDGVYLIGRAPALRLGIREEQIRPLVEGDVVRDWAISNPTDAIWPYDPVSLAAASGEAGKAVMRALWPWRCRLAGRVAYGKSQLEHGLDWFEYSMFFPNRFRTPLSIAFAFVATHNHFVLDRGGKVFNRSAPVIKLPAGSTEEDHLALLGLLNSSTLGFWMRQIFHVKGGESTGKKLQSEVWSRRLEFDSTKMGSAPVVLSQRERMIELALRLDSLSQQHGALAPACVLDAQWDEGSLEATLKDADRRRRAIHNAMIAFQEELDWTVYSAFGLASQDELVPVDEIEPIASEHRPFAIRLALAAQSGNATRYWFEAMGVSATIQVPTTYTQIVRNRFERRLALIEADPSLGLLESPEYKRKWEPSSWLDDVSAAAFEWLAARVEAFLRGKGRPLTQSHLIGAIQDDARLLEVAGIYQQRQDVDLGGLIAEIIAAFSVPEQRFHLYTESGLTKRAAWEETWALQRREDAGEQVGEIPVPPEYSQGSRGKSTDFLRNEYWQLRGKLDVPKERFIAFTEVPGRSGAETLYGWAGWTPLQRLKAILAIDEDLEDSGVPLADRVGLLDSAWRLLPDVAREDAAAAIRLKAELQALVGPEGPSREQIEDWRKRFPPPNTRAARAKRAAAIRDEDENEEGEAS